MEERGVVAAPQGKNVHPLVVVTAEEPVDDVAESHDSGPGPPVGDSPVCHLAFFSYEQF